MRLPWVKPSKSTVSFERDSFDIVWDGSDGFDVSPLPSFLSLDLEKRGRKSRFRANKQEKVLPDFIENDGSYTKRNLHFIEVRVGRKGSRINMNRSEKTRSAGSFNQKDGRKRLVDSSLRELTSASTDSGTTNGFFENDKNMIHTPGHPKLVLTEPLSVSVSNLADSEAFDSDDSDWHVGQEIHRERERLRHQYFENIPIDSPDQSRRFSGNRKGCVHLSLNPFHFACGADPNLSSPTAASQWDMSSVVQNDSWTMIA